MSKLRSPRKTLRYSLFAAAAVGGMTLAAGTAEAKPDIVRKGGQWGVMLGGSACIPGKAKCGRDSVTDGGITIDGKTRPSFGLAGELGYRFNKWVFLGAHYNFGLFDMDYEVTGTGAQGYKRGYQNSIYAMVRPTLPAWRFDFGLGVGPGFSRQTFVFENGDKDYSQGFSFIISPSIDIWVSRRIFLGVKADLLLNGHAKTCHKVGNMTECIDTVSRDVAPVHQTIFGLHIGGTFL
jgi:hypothetical protein